jgi:virginiamycin B lyase
MLDGNRAPREVYMRVMLGLVATALTGIATAQPLPDPQIDYWTVPWENSRPRDPDLDRNGLVWFVGQTGDYVAFFDPKNEQFKKIDLEKGSGPHNLIIGGDRAIWYSGNRAAHIGRLDPDSGEIEKITMPADVRDPHTLIDDDRGHIWFTAQGANYIGRLTLAGRKVDVVRVPIANSLPYGIVVDASGRPWANLLGTNKLATLTPSTLQLKLIDLPRSEARSRRIAVAADGGIWYVDYAAARLGRFDPKTRQFREWLPPTGEKARPYAMAIDDRGRIWFADSGAQPNRLMAFDARSEQFVVDTVLTNARGAVRHMVFHEPTRALWFGTDTNYLVRVKVP